MSPILDIVLPVFGLIGIGFALAKLGMLGERVRDGLSDFVFVVAIPVLMFRTIVDAKLPPHLPWDYWFAYFSAVLVVWVLGTVIVQRVFKRDERESALAGMSAGYSNNVFIGLPVVLKAFGPPGAVPVALLIAVHLPVLMTVVSVQVERAIARSGDGIDVRRLVRSMVTHPILIGLFAGALARVVGYVPAGPVKVIIDSLTATTVPTALVSTGLALASFGLAGSWRPALVLAALKLIVHPMLVWLLVVYVFKLEPLWAGTAVLLAASPSGITSFMLAQRYGIGVEMASTCLALSTGLAVFTTTIWLIVLGVG